MSKHILKTFLNDSPKPYVARAHGIILELETGETLLDFTGGVTEHAIVGWSNEKVIEAICQQSAKFPHIDYKTFGDRGRDQLSDLLISPAKHELDKVYFAGSSGGEACEAAMKLSYQYFCDSGRPEKTWFIGREQSYHGSTSDCLSLNDRPNLLFYEPFFPRHRVKIPEHNSFRHQLENESEEEYEDRSVKDLVEAIEAIGPAKVAGFIGETIQGGLVGATPPTKNYWSKVRAVCDHYDIHLIIDEVWCGTGTSGKYYCIDWDDVTPDFLFMGKTLAAGYAPISVVLTSSEVENVLRKGQGRIQHSTTHQGYSIGVAAAVAVQSIIQSPGFLDEVNEKGEFIRNYLTGELSDHPFFRNIRGRGLRLAMEFKCRNQQVFCDKLERNMRQQHSILMSVKWHRANFTPALTATMNEIAQVLAAFVCEFKTLSLDKEHC